MSERETRTALPSTPAVVHRGWVKPMPRRSRLEYIIWGTAILFGSTIGGTLALRAEPAPVKATAAQPATAGAGAAPNPAGGAASSNPASGAAATNPAGGAAPNSPGSAASSTKIAVVWSASAGASAAPNSAGGAAAANPAGGAAATSAGGAATVETADRAAQGAARAQIADALRRFVSWSRGHAGPRCPDAVALGAPPDPWGHALRVTCTDQPADQIAGVVSAGPDGIAGTRDDIESWTLGDAVTDLVRGPRWHAGRSAIRPPSSTTPPKQPPASPGAGSSDHDGDGIPDRR